MTQKRHKQNRTEKRKSEKDISKIRNVLKDKSKEDPQLKVMGKIKYLDRQGDVRIYADIVLGRAIQYFWIDSVRLKVGNIIKGQFVAQKDHVFILI